MNEWVVFLRIGDKNFTFEVGGRDLEAAEENARNIAICGIAGVIRKDVYLNKGDE